MEDKTWKIIAVSPTPAKPYTNTFGTTYYRDVRLADEQGNEHAKPVSLGKKSEDAFVVGAELFGHIFVEQSRPTDKFKAASKQQGSFGGGFTSSQQPGAPSSSFGSSSKPAYQPRDDDAIRAQWAIGQAVSATTNKSDQDGFEQDVERLAKHFYSMVDRVKGSNGGETPNPKAQGTSSTALTTSKSWVVNSRTNALWPSDRKAEDSSDAEAQSLYASIASAGDFAESELPPGTL